MHHYDQGNKLNRCQYFIEQIIEYPGYSFESGAGWFQMLCIKFNRTISIVSIFCLLSVRGIGRTTILEC